MLISVYVCYQESARNLKMFVVLFKGPIPKKPTKSITFTFVSQFGANFEVNFLEVYRNCWLTLIFQKTSIVPENQIFR